jgi:hypothetical protein
MGLGLCRRLLNIECARVERRELWGRLGREFCLWGSQAGRGSLKAEMLWTRSNAKPKQLPKTCSRD